MSLDLSFRNLMRSTRRASHTSFLRRYYPRLEALEARTLLSNIVWINRGDAAHDTDNFTGAYGNNNAALARAIVDRALNDWSNVVQNFNYSAPGHYDLTINAADLADGGRGVTSITTVDVLGKPHAATITVDDDGGTGGWFFDPTPSDDSEYTTLLRPNGSFAATDGGAVAMNDFYRTIVHEVGHAMGIDIRTVGGNTLALNNFVAPAGADQLRVGSSLFLFAAGNTSATLTDTTGIHTYEGPVDPSFPNDPIFPNDLMNAGRTVALGVNERQLISDIDAKILRDSYGYTVTLPSQVNTFYAELDSTTGVLNIVGDPGASNDVVSVERIGTNVRVQVNATCELIPLGSIVGINIVTGGGNDSITIDLSGGALTSTSGSITIDGGIGEDQLKINLTEVINAHFSFAAADAGRWSFGNRPPITFTGIENAPSSGVLLQDDFNDNTLDTSKWTTDTSVPPPHGPASVTEQNHRIELRNRGHLVTAQEFDPTLVGALRITGTWTFPSGSNLSGRDFMQILTRSDGIPSGDYGETLNGIEFIAYAGGGMAILTRVNGAGGDSTRLATGGVEGGIASDQPFNFTITDDGLNLSFTIQVIGGGSGTVTASSPLRFATNHVVFHNREFTFTHNLSYLDDVVISTIGMNHAPTASNDTYNVDQDTVLVKAAPSGILPNDADSDADPLKAVLLTGPAHGTLTLNGDGSFTYTPNPAFVGTDSFSYKANDGLLDSNTATVSIDVLARVQTITVNDGSAQRSMVTSLSVAFGTKVTVDPGAFELVKQGGGSVGFSVALSLVGGKTVALLTFSGADIVGHSLADGQYQLVIHSSKIHDSLGRQLDGDGNGVAGGDGLASFFRLFGDTNGDGKVDNYDLALLRSTFGKHAGDAAFLWYFDYDGNGNIDRNTDYAQFNLRYGRHI